MSARSAQMLPPKMAAQFAERVKRGEGHRVSPNSEMYEFPQGGNVIVLMDINQPFGHVVRDPRRAQALRDIESGAKK